MKNYFIVAIFLLTIFNTYAAVTPPVKAINAHNAFIDGKFKNGTSSYEQFGNYNNRFFPMGWMDEFATAGEEASGKKTFEQYRKVMGDVNVIRVGSVDELIWNYGDYTRNGKSYKGILSTLDESIAPLKFIIGIKRVKDKSEQSIDLLKKQIKLCDSIFIKSGRNNKYIIGWYIDEPNNMSNGVPVFTDIQFKAYTAAIREAEKRCGWSKRLIFANFADYNNDKNRIQYIGNYIVDENVDIICVDNYTFQASAAPFHLRGTPSSINTITNNHYHPILMLRRIMDSNIKTKNKPIVYVPQGQAHKDNWKWENWKRNNDPQSVGKMPSYEIFNTLWNRVPSYSETRFSIWSAIAQGATGILPWAARIVYHPCPSDASMEYVRLSNQFYGQKINESSFYTKERDLTFNYWKEIFNELNILSKYICDGTKEDNLFTWQILDAPDDFAKNNFGYENYVNTICVKYDKKYYLIAVNNNNWPPTQNKVISHTIKFNLNKKFLPNGINDDILIKCIDPKAYNTDNTKILPTEYLKHRTIILSEFNKEISYFTDRFEAGDVHVYEISIVQK